MTRPLFFWKTWFFQKGGSAFLYQVGFGEGGLG